MHNARSTQRRPCVPTPPIPSSTLSGVRVLPVHICWRRPRITFPQSCHAYVVSARTQAVQLSSGSIISTARISSPERAQSLRLADQHYSCCSRCCCCCYHSALTYTLVLLRAVQAATDFGRPWLSVDLYVQTLPAFCLSSLSGEAVHNTGGCKPCGT